jgi:hypothetical protein
MNMTKGFANRTVDMNKTLHAVESTDIPSIPHEKNSILKTQRNKMELHFRMIGEYVALYFYCYECIGSKKSTCLLFQSKLNLSLVSRNIHQNWYYSSSEPDIFVCELYMLSLMSIYDLWCIILFAVLLKNLMASGVGPGDVYASCVSALDSCIGLQQIFNFALCDLTVYHALC